MAEKGPGKKSSKRYDVPLNYIRDGDALVCFTGKSWSGWWRNVGEKTPVSVRVKGRDLPATASLVSEPDAVERALGAFLESFPSNAKQFGVALDADKRPDAQDVARATHGENTVMIRISTDEPTAESRTTNRSS